jgi:hypothetical protein
VVWYRTANETHNADGEHISYLDPVHRSSACSRELDPDLYERLGHELDVKAMQLSRHGGPLPMGLTHARLPPHA